MDIHFFFIMIIKTKTVKEMHMMNANINNGRNIILVKIITRVHITAVYKKGNNYAIKEEES